MANVLNYFNFVHPSLRICMQFVDGFDIMSWGYEASAHWVMAAHMLTISLFRKQTKHCTTDASLGKQTWRNALRKQYRYTIPTLALWNFDQ